LRSIGSSTDKKPPSEKSSVTSEKNVRRKLQEIVTKLTECCLTLITQYDTYEVSGDFDSRYSLDEGSENVMHERSTGYFILPPPVLSLPSASSFCFCSSSSSFSFSFCLCFSSSYFLFHFHFVFVFLLLTFFSALTKDRTSGSSNTEANTTSNLSNNSTSSLTIQREPLDGLFLFSNDSFVDGYLFAFF
jgi:hypothetical protein